MQIDSLKVFCDVVETGSFTKAAQLNEVTQSAVSQQVGALERTFNSLLVERSKKHFRLTREGEVVYEYSRQVLQAVRNLESRLQELKEAVSGTIRVATIYSIGLHELPPCLKRFLQAFPGVKVQVEYRRAPQVYADVIGNVVDIGLVAFPERHPKLESYPISEDMFVLICHPQHPFAAHRSIPLQFLAREKLIGFEPDTPTRKGLDKILKDHAVPVEHVMEFDNIEMVKRAVEIDAGVAIVPRGNVAQELEQGSLAQVLFEDGQFFRPVAAIYRKDKVLSPAAKQFLEVFRQQQATCQTKI